MKFLHNVCVYITLQKDHNNSPRSAEYNTQHHFYFSKSPFLSSAERLETQLTRFLCQQDPGLTSTNQRHSHSKLEEEESRQPLFHSNILTDGRNGLYSGFQVTSLHCAESTGAAFLEIPAYYCIF